MIDNSEYKLLYGTQSLGKSGVIGIKILVASDKLPSLEVDKLRFAAYKAVDKIEDEIKAAICALDESSQTAAKEERGGLLGAFPNTIFVEEIPNEYCSNGCFRHLPWFVVTTTIGRFKIGWRKSVIHLEWTETRGTERSEKLFEEEKVTKYEKVIHAYSYEKVKEYIAAIFASA